MLRNERYPESVYIAQGALKTARRHPSLPRITTAAAGAVLVVLTAACGSGSTTGSAAPSPSESSSPESSQSESVPAGATVTVENLDTEVHSVTSSEDGAFNLNIPAGQSTTFTAVADAGDYAFTCLFLGNMSGVLTVAG